jgi:hypothetical protein
LLLKARQAVSFRGCPTFGLPIRNDRDDARVEDSEFAIVMLGYRKTIGIGGPAMSDQGDAV